MRHSIACIVLEDCVGCAITPAIQLAQSFHLSHSIHPLSGRAISALTVSANQSP